jgi:hypothetical protein
MDAEERSDADLEIGATKSNRFFFKTLKPKRSAPGESDRADVHHVTSPLKLVFFDTFETGETAPLSLAVP